jgi:glucose-1-phosphate thymidylyltransferase
VPRPHTLTIPKPLIPIAGKTATRLVEDAGVLNQDIEEVALSFMKVLSESGRRTLVIAQNWVLKEPFIIEALGTGHAIMCAKESLSGPA